MYMNSVFATRSMASDSPVDYFFHSPQRYTRAESPEFSQSEAEFYATLSNVGLDKPFVYYNSEPMRTPSAHTAANAAKGYAVRFDKDTPLSSLTNDDNKLLLSDRWFGRISILKIPPAAIPPGMDRNDMAYIIRMCRQVIDGGTPEFVADRTKLSEAILGVMGSTDATAWREGLFGHGHFAGLFEDAKTELGGSTSYYLAVHSDADMLGHALNRFAVEHRDMTLGEFYRSPQYNSVESYAMRNSRRIMATMAQLLLLDRKEVPLVDDMQAKLDRPDEPPPEMISSLLWVDTVYNCFYDPDGVSLIYYNTCARIMDAFTTSGGRVAMLKNASKGLSVVQLETSKSYTNRKHDLIYGHESSHLLEHANPYGALPVGVGRIDKKKELRDALDKRDYREAVEMIKASGVDLKGAGQLHDAYQWDGDLEQRARKFTDVVDVLATLDPRLYDYRKHDCARSIITFMVGKTEEKRLTPVAVVLPAGTAT